VAKRSGQVEIAEFHYVDDGQGEAAEKIKSILIDSQNKLLALFRGE